MSKSLSLLAAWLLAGINLFAQSPYAGSWEGKLKLGTTDLRIVFHVKDSAGGLSARLDSPDQEAFGIPADTAYTEAGELVITLKNLRASFRGSLAADTLLRGTFTQGLPFPLELRKVDKPSERRRPQTPRSPFPYKSEDLVYKNADGSLEYGATFTCPAGDGPFPAAILITGSGQQNRDEEIMGHKLFAVIADHLTRAGYAILRVDDRGIGKSTGDFSKATSADFADDVNAGVNYLLTRPEVDKQRVGLIGHSEGGMIAPMVATRRQDIAFVILLAAPGAKIIDLMCAQVHAIIRSGGVGEPAAKAYEGLYRKALPAAANAKDSVAAVEALNRIYKRWVKRTDTALLRELGMDLPKNRATSIRMTAGVANTPWFRYFLAFDPVPYLQKLNCKVLALNGDKDIQVLAEQNLEGIRKALARSQVPVQELKSLPGLNHLFQTCKRCNLAEYGELEETISPVALQAMSDWLNREVGAAKKTP